MEVWLNAVGARIKRDAPDLLPMFDVYAGEARFGRNFIAEDLARLPPNAAVLETGAGAYLLSCQLVREGFDVTAIEPVGEGFSHFRRMQSLVTALATEMQCMPGVVARPAEAFDERDCYDFAFSINVMEHVRDVGAVIERVTRGLRVGACYHFTCPNYLFPYEPHFNMPTLLGKRLTERWMGSRIFSYAHLEDPRGTWDSLNWITVGQIKRVLRSRPELSVRFDRRLLTRALERVAHDAEYAARRPAMLRRCIGALVRTRLHMLPAMLPAAVLPIIDCRIDKRFGSATREEMVCA
ncbi:MULTISPECIES: methyltransferase domain-containing protein [unclassified Cupriavidus]|uniref:methyltransferase domain-containing protein n=1 Tax=Cupriavidus sp. H19C3 TaxID=3241603 RepID=UPI003BF8D408